MTEEHINRAHGLAPNDMPGEGAWLRRVLDDAERCRDARILLPGLHEALRLAHVAEDSDLVVGRIMKRITELEGAK